MDGEQTAIEETAAITAQTLDSAAASAAQGLVDKAEDIAKGLVDRAAKIAQDLVDRADAAAKVVATPIPGYTNVGDGFDSRLLKTPDKVTNVQLWELMAQTREDGLGTRTQVLALRSDFVDLREHVNDQLEAMNVIIGGKADKDELLTSWGERMMTNKFVRWGVGLAFGGLVASATLNHWWHISISWALRLAEG